MGIYDNMYMLENEDEGRVQIILELSNTQSPEQNINPLQSLFSQGWRATWMSHFVTLNHIFTFTLNCHTFIAMLRSVSMSSTFFLLIYSCSYMYKNIYQVIWMIYFLILGFMTICKTPTKMNGQSFKFPDRRQTNG